MLCSISISSGTDPKDYNNYLFISPQQEFLNATTIIAHYHSILFNVFFCCRAVWFLELRYLTQYGLTKQFDLIFSLFFQSFLVSAETDKDELNDVNQKMINENQALVLKFQELDINQATLIEKYSKQIANMEEKHEEKVLEKLFVFKCYKYKLFILYLCL